MDAVRRIPVRTVEDVKRAKPEIIRAGTIHRFSRTTGITTCGKAVPEGDARWVKMQVQEGEVTCARCQGVLVKGVKPTKPKAPRKASDKAQAQATHNRVLGKALGIPRAITPAPKPESGKRKRKPKAPASPLTLADAWDAAAPTSDDTALTNDLPDGSPASPATPNTPDEVTADTRDMEIPF